jgi:hypothetical protein
MNSHRVVSLVDYYVTKEPQLAGAARYRSGQGLAAL